MNSKRIKCDKINWSDSSDTEAEENAGNSIKLSDRRCPYCIKLFKSAVDLAKHEKNCTVANNYKAKRVTCKDGGKKFICQICCSTYKYLNAFQLHEKKHDPPGGFCCRYCDYRFCHEAELEKHKKEKHKEFLCQMCKVTFETRELYFEHIKVHHDGRTDEYKVCEDCGRKFRYTEHLNYHKNTNCQTIFPFKCNECGKSFRSKGILKTHSLIHSGEKKFSCSFCTLSFICKAQKIVHERKHTGEKPYKCDICSKAFAHRESLVTHSSTHSGMKPYLCVCCDARFSCVSSILAHRRTRPDTCGLPEYCTKLAKACPRASVRSKLSSEIKNVRPVTVIKTSEKEKLIKKHKPKEESKVVKNPKTKRHKKENASIGQPDKSNNSYKNSEKVDKSSNMNINNGNKIESSAYTNISNVTIKKSKRNIKIVNYSEEEIENNYQDVEIKNEKVIENEEHCIDKFPITVNPQHEVENAEFKIKCEIESINTEEAYSNDLIKKMIEIGDEIKQENSFEDENSNKMNSGSSNNDLKCKQTPDLLDKDSDSNNYDSLSFKDDFSDSDEEPISIRNENSSKSTKLKENQTEGTKLIKLTSRKDIFECIECIHKQQFRRKISYEEHLRNRHNKTVSQIIEILSLKNHKPSDYSCKICGKSFTYPKSLNQHIKLHGTDGKLIIKCRTCSNYFANKKELFKHAKENHKKEVTCLICDKIYSDIGSLEAHKRYAHSEREKNSVQSKTKSTFICNKCGKIFSSNYYLLNHELSKCGTELQYKCNECGKALSSPATLKTHMMIHRGELPFLCPFCSKGFRTKAPMVVHQRMHTGQKPFHCTYCEKTFAYRENLFIHLSTHTGIKRYMCVTCSERFSCISGLKNHWRTHAETCGADPNRTTKAVGEFMGYRNGQLEHKKKTM